MNTIRYGGWKNNVILKNGQLDLVVTLDVGPRIIRCGFSGRRNLLAELDGQSGGSGERKWMIRGGHRLWIAPEAKPLTYELDNEPVRCVAIPGGIRTVQKRGRLSGVVKQMDIRLDPRANRVSIRHTLRNEGRRPIELAAWALTVMAPGGKAVIPLPAKIPHTRRLTHNQEWSLWGYTDLSDPRWTIGSKYLVLRQDRRRADPTKLGLANREGWVAYQLGGDVLVKEFSYVDGARYPDGGVNFETFTNSDFLEMETLSPLVRLKPGQAVCHDEQWRLFSGVPACDSEARIDRFIRHRIR